MKRIIHNTSFIIQEGIESQWLIFIREYLIKTIEDDKLCNDIIFTKVSIDQPDGKTYSLQLVFHSEPRQAEFVQNRLPQLIQKMYEQFGEQCLYFNSILTEI